jgi:cell division protein FtsB
MIRGEKKSFLKILFYSSFFTIILLAFLVISLISFVRTLNREKEVKGQIAELETEINDLEGNNTDLNKAIEYFQTDFYKEKEAREKFDMKQPDEKVIVIVEPDQPQIKTEDVNPKKWWEYIFK